MNMSANNCPCCGNSLLRHIRHNEVYWFCQSCWQEVPLLTHSRPLSVQARSRGILSRKVAKS